MPKKLGRVFHRDRVRLSPGGVFEFDAVSDDGKTIATISTTDAKTASGRVATGKLTKIRSDMYFLLLVPDVDRRIVILTEKGMFDLCTKEQENGRVHRLIEFVHAEIPDNLRSKLRMSREAAAKEGRTSQ
jgi:hypothetical protein